MGTPGRRRAHGHGGRTVLADGHRFSIPTASRTSALLARDCPGRLEAPDKSRNLGGFVALLETADDEPCGCEGHSAAERQPRDAPFDQR